jgi:hypothetical protein
MDGFFSGPDKHVKTVVVTGGDEGNPIMPPTAPPASVNTPVTAAEPSVVSNAQVNALEPSVVSNAPVTALEPSVVSNAQVNALEPPVVSNAQVNALEPSVVSNAQVNAPEAVDASKPGCSDLSLDPLECDDDCELKLIKAGCMYTIMSRVLYTEDNSIGKTLERLTAAVETHLLKQDSYLETQLKQQTALDRISESLSLIADHIGQLVKPDNSEAGEESEEETGEGSEEGEGSDEEPASTEEAGSEEDVKNPDTDSESEGYPGQGRIPRQ